MNIGVFGVSGVGKSYLIERVVDELIGYKGFKASDILKAYNKETSFSKLGEKAVGDNQKSLIEGFKSIVEENRGIHCIIELHNLIETSEGVVEISDLVFDSLGLDAVCFLYEEAAEVLRHRQQDGSRSRPQPSVAELEVIQDRSLSKFLAKYEQGRLPFLVLSSTAAQGELTKFLRSLSG